MFCVIYLDKEAALFLFYWKLAWLIVYASLFVPLLAGFFLNNIVDYSHIEKNVCIQWCIWADGQNYQNMHQYKHFLYGKQVVIHFISQKYGVSHYKLNLIVLVYNFNNNKNILANFFIRLNLLCMKCDGSTLQFHQWHCYDC